MAPMTTQLSLKQCHVTPLLHLRLQILRFLVFDAKGGQSESMLDLVGVSEWVF